MTYLEWIQEKRWRKITIEEHCYGARVTLSEGLYPAVSVTAVEATDSLAFHEALKVLPAARDRHQAEKIKKKKEELTKARAKVRELNAEIKQLKDDQ